jgi:hypothetical protein
MNARKIITIGLSLFIAASVVYLIANETKSPVRDKASATETSRGGNTTVSDSSVPKKDHAVMVYYFHTTFRCPTCRKIEELTAKTIQEKFSGNISDGVLAWKAVNIEEAPNRHFTDDYQLFTKSVVIVDTVKGKQVRWKNLDRIWELVRDEAAFTNYIKNEINGYLETI